MDKILPAVELQGSSDKIVPEASPAGYYRDLGNLRGSPELWALLLWFLGEAQASAPESAKYVPEFSRLPQQRLLTLRGNSRALGNPEGLQNPGPRGSPHILQCAQVHTGWRRQ
jgi:hypothetical protein